MNTIGKYSQIAYGVVVGIAIILLIVIGGLFSAQGSINQLLYLGFACNSIAAAIALYVTLFRGSRKWIIWAIMLFIFGMFFELFGLLPST